jgi:hypothetical protein
MLHGFPIGSGTHDDAYQCGHAKSPVLCIIQKLGHYRIKGTYSTSTSGEVISNAWGDEYKNNPAWLIAAI